MKQLDWRCGAPLALTAFVMLAAWNGKALAQTAVPSTASASASAPAADSGATAPRPRAVDSTQRNVYVGGSSVRPDGPVQGDFLAFGGKVTVDQPVAGDALLAGGSVDVRGAIGDDLRAAGGDVSIEGTVGGELFAAGGNVSLASGAKIAQGASIAGGRVSIDGTVDGRLRVTSQRVVINGVVNGDARLMAETIELGPKARITGALNHTSRELKRAEGAVVGGAVTLEDRDDRMPHARGGNTGDMRDMHWGREWQASGPSWVGAVMGFIGLLAAGAVFVLLLPRFSNEATAMIRSAPWASLAIGFGVVVGVPVLAVLLMLTLLGIPLGIAAFALYPLLLLLGYLAGVMFVGQRIRLAMGKDSTPSFRTTMGYFALGLLVLMLIGSLPVVGGLTVFITVLFGLGASVLEWHRRRQVPPSTPSSPLASPPPAAGPAALA